MSKITNITIRLPAKSSASSFSDVNNLIKDIDEKNIRKEGKFQFIEFIEKSNLLNQIIETAYKLSAFKLIINDEEIDRRDLLRTTRYALFCPFESNCQGLCQVDMINFDNYSFQKLTTFFNFKKYLEYFNDDKIKRFQNKYSWFNVNNQKDTYYINKNKLKEEIQYNFILQNKYCDIFDWNKIDSQINIPESGNFIYSPSDLSSDMEDDEEDEEEQNNSDSDIKFIDDPIILLNIISAQLDELPQKINESIRKLFVETGLLKNVDEKTTDSK